MWTKPISEWVVNGDICGVQWTPMVAEPDKADLDHFYTNGWFPRFATLADEVGSRLIWCVRRVKFAKAAVRAGCREIEARMTELRTLPPFANQLLAFGADTRATQTLSRSALRRRESRAGKNDLVLKMAARPTHTTSTSMDSACYRLMTE
jgi:hypothetical protein